MLGNHPSLTSMLGATKFPETSTKSHEMSVLVGPSCYGHVCKPQALQANGEIPQLRPSATYALFHFQLTSCQS